MPLWFVHKFNNLKVIPLKFKNITYGVSNNIIFIIYSSFYVCQIENLGIRAIPTNLDGALSVLVRGATTQGPMG
jgi:hypothetical protein